jgi:GT2 family glycosyltransferase
MPTARAFFPFNPWRFTDEASRPEIMPAPAVSICIPAYQAGAFIGETLASLRAQTFVDWEAQVVEDGTNDDTEKHVRAFAAGGAQSVHFQRHAVNQGLPATRNTAIATAQGEWIALLDADDLWTPRHLELAIALARETGAEIIHTGVVLFESESGRELATREPSAEALAAFPLSLFRGDYPIQPSSALIRRDALVRAGGFDPRCRYVEDRELWLRLVRGGARVSFVAERTCRYRQHGAAMTRNASAMALGVAEVFERNADWEAIPAGLRRERAASGWLDAARLVLRSDPRLARTYLARARRHRPLSPRLFAYDAAAALLSFSRKKSA